MTTTRCRLAATLLPLALVLSVWNAWPAHAAKDKTAPKARFVTEEDAAVSQVTPVEGKARDRGAGIKKVKVIFCPGGKTPEGGWVCNGVPTSTVADLDCNETRSRCTWTAAPPLKPGSYLVFATAKDRAKNERTIGPRQVMVL